MKKFIDDLRRELIRHHMNEDDIEEIIRDHEEMIRTALAEGLPESGITERFGDPIRLAQELAAGNSSRPSSESVPEGFTVWKSLSVSEKSLIAEIRLVDEDLELRRSDHPEIRVFHRGNHSMDRFEVSCQNGLFLFKSKKENERILFNPQHAFLVEIPSDIQLSNLGLGVVSGDVKVQDLNLGSMEIDSTSGDLRLDQLQADTARWNTVSGDVSITDCRFGSVSSTQVSGDVHFQMVKVDHFQKIHSVSGDVRISETSAEECEMETVSGDIVGREFYPLSLSVRTMSGDVVINNREPGRIQKITQRTMSGEIRIN